MNMLSLGSVPPLRCVTMCVSLLLLTIVGCDSSTKPSGSGKKSASRPKGDDRFVGTIMGMCEPDRLGLDSSPDQVAGLLNQWWMRSGESDELANAFGSQAIARLENEMPAGTLNRAADARFDERDVEFIRDAQMFREIVDLALSQEDHPEPALFDWVVRNVELEADSDSVAKTPYEIVMFGRGTAEERAWVFAELMRQLRLDTFIIKPQDADDSSRWLVAVEDENGLGQLYDPVVGVPVPTSTDWLQNVEPKAASLQQLHDNEELWKSLYPAGDGFGEQDFTSWDAEAIGTSTLWAPRMQQLQQSVSADALTAVIYQPLPEPDRKLPFVKKISLWPFPEKQLVARYTTEEPLRYANLWLPFQMPFSVEVPGGVLQAGDANQLRNSLQLGQPLQLQLKARTSQLGGDLSSAIQEYINVRLQCTRMDELSNVPTELRRSHSKAFEDAYFWIGVCQFELGRLEQAAQTFASYVDHELFRDRGSHLEQARLLLAQCQNTPEDRAIYLREIPDGSPAKDQADFELRKLQSLTPDDVEPTVEPKEAAPSKPSGPAVAEKP